MPVSSLSSHTHWSTPVGIRPRKQRGVARTLLQTLSFMTHAARRLTRTTAESSRRRYGWLCFHLSNGKVTRDT